MTTVDSCNRVEECPNAYSIRSLSCVDSVLESLGYTVDPRSPAERWQDEQDAAWQETYDSLLPQI